jgi:sporulation protein YlmC with PRC-barrel domain
MTIEEFITGVEESHFGCRGSDSGSDRSVPFSRDLIGKREPKRLLHVCSATNAQHNSEDRTLLKAAVKIAAAVAALLPGVAFLAPAEAASPAPTIVATANPGGIIQPSQMRASKMIGSTVYDVQNRDIGSVKDVIFDRNGRVAAVVVDVGAFLGIGGKDVALRLSQIKADNNRLTLDQTKDQLLRAQSYQLEDPDTGAGATVSPAQGGHLGVAAGPTAASHP